MSNPSISGTTMTATVDVKIKEIIIIEHPCEAQNGDIVQFRNKCAFCGLESPKSKKDR